MKVTSGDAVLYCIRDLPANSDIYTLYSVCVAVVVHARFVSVCMKRENNNNVVYCCMNKKTKDINETHTHTHAQNEPFDHPIDRSYDTHHAQSWLAGWSFGRSFKCALISQLIIKCDDHCSFFVWLFCDNEMGWECDNIIAGRIWQFVSCCSFVEQKRSNRKPHSFISKGHCQYHSQIKASCTHACNVSGLLFGWNLK